MEEPKKFKAEYKTINGKKILFITPEIEEVVKEDGTKNVVIHVPALSTTNSQLQIGGK